MYKKPISKFQEQNWNVPSIEDFSIKRKYFKYVIVLNIIIFVSLSLASKKCSFLQVIVYIHICRASYTSLFLIRGEVVFSFCIILISLNIFKYPESIIVFRSIKSISNHF